MEIIEENVKLLIEKPLYKKAFYNPQMKIVRNLNIEIYKNYAREGYKFLDLLASIGANSIRVKKSLPFLEVYSNDVSKDAINLLKENTKINEVKINVFNENAKNLKCKLMEKFNIIDIDPFGSPIKFFPYVIDFLSKETLLSLTATDLGTLSGKYSDACLARYGIFCAENDMKNEIALRNLISYSIRYFSSFGFSFEIIFSYSEKHFAKTYILLRKTSKKKVQKKLKDNIGFISYCPQCLYKTLEIEKECKYCGSKMKIIGPTYLGKLFDEKFLSKAIKSVEHSDVKKIFEKSLNDFAEDYSLPPTTFNTHLIAKNLKTNVKSIEILIKSLNEIGIKASKSYLDSKSIRTKDFKSLIEIFKK
ncbi:MAG: hypothetical protein QW197_00315 [Candidatus Aenigmatarchaeota archaeon]